jgi:hypothetical protein
MAHAAAPKLMPAAVIPPPDKNPNCSLISICSVIFARNAGFSQQMSARASAFFWPAHHFYFHLPSSSVI